MGLVILALFVLLGMILSGFERRMKEQQHEQAKYMALINSRLLELTTAIVTVRCGIIEKLYEAGALKDRRKETR